MGKRFFDTEIFKKPWFRKLETKYKSFWWYALSNCDIAGILELDIEASEFFIGEEIILSEVEEKFKSQIIRLDEKRFYLKDFVEFQNGSILNSKSPVHAKIINILEKYRLFDRVSNRVCNTPVVIVGVVEEVKEVVEEKGIVGVVEVPKTEKPILTYPFTSLEFKTLWAGWKHYLIEAKKPYQTFSSEQAALQFLSDYTEPVAIGIIKKAIQNQWKNLREPEKNEQQPNSYNQRKTGIIELNKLSGQVLQGFELDENYTSPTE